MPLDTQTTIFMTSFVYLMLHGAIWLALKEYRSDQVKLWCASGIVSGIAVAFWPYEVPSLSSCFCMLHSC